MEFISGSSNPDLAKKIVKLFKKDILEIHIEKFPNGEKRIFVKKPVWGKDVCLVQSFYPLVDEYIIETLLIVDALKRYGAKSIHLIIPWLGYSLQDRAFRDGEPISARVIADMMSRSGASTVFLLDLHNSSIPGFFSIPTYQLSAYPLFVEYMGSKLSHKINILASPDIGGVRRVQNIAEQVNLPFVIIEKKRDIQSGKITTLRVNGDVRNKVIAIFDDGILTGKTLSLSAKLLKENGAKKVYFFATHAIFSSQAETVIENSKADIVVVSNSVAIKVTSSKIKVVNIASLFYKFIRQLNY